MVEYRRRRTRARSAVIIAALAIAMPACQSPGWAPSPSVRPPEAGTSRFALRPILEGEGYRPYYLGGYAGATYGPGLFRRNSMAGGPAAPAGPSNVIVNEGTWTPQ